MTGELEVPHESRTHSRLGASGAHRWLACPGSIRLSAGIEDKGSIYAAEGTAAHELGERCLRDKFADAADAIGEEIVVGNHKFVVTEEMAEAVQVYVDTIKADYEDGDILFIEKRFDLSNIWEGMFGTNDCGLYKKDGSIKVYDYKHGAGYAVEAENNVQLAYYGIGLVNVPSLKGAAISSVELVIVQPRAPHKDGPVRRWMTDAVHLLEFMEDLRAGAEATTAPDAPLAAGSWCKFCPAAGICPEMRQKAIVEAQAEFVDVVPGDLSEIDISDLLEKCGLIEDGIRAIRMEAYNRVAGGTKIPGWKLVAKRAIRKWSNEDPATIAGALLLTFEELDEAQIVEKKVKSPAQVEKLLPKALRADLAALVTKTSSGTTLARESDRRAEVEPSAAAADEFDPV
jgi:hypothetical protein